MADGRDDQPLGILGLLGVGLDGDGQDTRISRGPNFMLYGGSKGTHEKMQETAIEFNKRVDERGKKLADINRRELQEIVEQVRDEAQ